MIKSLLIILLILLIIIFFLIIGIKSKQQAIQTYSVPFFIKSYSNLIDKGHSEQNKTFIEKINDFFDDNENSDMNGDGNSGFSNSSDDFDE
ncbi:hypothetical protein ACFSO7_16160 [Bacillus sp. CGMCC 1.16607]|uniref:hypothetical protein n=1 Tax=Bacillus sp. CGMCC 1.16607 TaxID=3351842 RepID=UPI0036373BEF